MLHLPRNLHFKVHQVLLLRRNLNFEVHKVLYLSRNLHFEVHKVLHLPRKLHFEAKHPRSLAPVRKSRLKAPKHEVPLRLPRKVTTMCENVHGTTTRAQSPEAPAADTQIQRACAVEVHMDDVESHECTVNSNERISRSRPHASAI